MKNILKIFAVSGLLAHVTTSCSDWLQVDLEDSILESSLFETNEGYTSVLNGVYTRMNEQYASTLTMGTIDAMAKLYDVGMNHDLYTYYAFSFDDTAFDSMSGSIWTGLYSQIANLNTLLEYCDSNDSALKAHYYPYVKGEALALRAMFHLDLLRIYGPIYSEETANTICIPYQETTSKEIQPLLSASEVMGKIIRDLKEAATLLKDDKIRTDGVMNGMSEDPNETSDFRYRQYRMNYYAVQGLLARAYLWKGDNISAYELAYAIIEENKEKQVFTWIPKASVQGSNPDLLFSTEVMFALYNPSRVNLYDYMFNPSASFSSLLTFPGGSMSEGDVESKITYFYTDLDDLRRTQMWSLETVEEVSDGGTVKEHSLLCFSKYKNINTSETRRYMIPLLRLSEIYLIAAECTDNLEEAVGYINEIRTHRNCIDITADSRDVVQGYIDAEFAREMIGEGQLYFYYKRLGKTSVLSGSTEDYTADWYGDVAAYTSMLLQEYVWPLPKVEKDRRGN